MGEQGTDDACSFNSESRRREGDCTANETTEPRRSLGMCRTLREIDNNG